ncbi:hypothetical protein CBR_g34519 [Chara braunii]|uniref:DUF538 family protein n=1 Tax=Chara braunii TaxID=69332 RepID=A0A388LIT8_CHABU|nr:hypothetical protein CBR_g34519 [Chara braunii]|eukprot:GBG82236.1 hypothetical protein CBR_g34519 [Chara braunii]
MVSIATAQTLRRSGDVCRGRLLSLRADTGLHLHILHILLLLGTAFFVMANADKGAASAAAQSAYDVLTSFGLPPGLLPLNVKDYDLQPSGHFSVELEHDCYIKLASGTPVYYAQKVTGVLQKQRLFHLSGIQAKELLWLPVTAIEMGDSSSDTITFRVGFLSKQLSLEEFAKPRACSRSLDGCTSGVA